MDISLQRVLRISTEQAALAVQTMLRVLTAPTVPGDTDSALDSSSETSDAAVAYKPSPTTTSFITEMIGN